MYKQDVFLLNTSLTTFVNEPGAHLSIWNEFVVKIIETLSEQSSGIIFCLWGDNIKYEKFINSKLHYVLISDEKIIGNNHCLHSFYGCYTKNAF